MPPSTSFSSLESPAFYRIVVLGRLDQSWADWLDDMAISLEETATGQGLSTLTGRVTDQAALLGLLRNLYTMGLTLYSLLRLENLPEVFA
jgi:hypothetical protein